MTRRGCCGILTAMCWLVMAGAAVAGPYDVTFQVPLESDADSNGHHERTGRVRD